MTKRSACLIFNPVAGTRDPKDDLFKIRILLEDEFNLEICLTQPDVSARMLAEGAIAQGAELLIASGGDGTLSAVAGTLLHTDIPLGIISRGTANAFAAALEIPVELEEACLTILDGRIRTVDAARCNDKMMVLLAGIGLEAETVENADREAKERLGAMAYIMSGLRQLQDLPTFEVKIETEEKTLNCSACAVTVANAAPPTSILAQGNAEVICDDGLLDVTIITPTNSPQVLATLYHLLKTALNHTSSQREDIIYLRTKRVIISTDSPRQVAIDGEIDGTTPLEIVSLPQSLRMIVPKQKESEGRS
jgi:YegS/Rv2252/BmrU family lipid kinase